jgi:hypothetical protein
VALGQQHPVDQVGQFGQRGLAGRGRFGDQVQASALERWVAVGVLSQQPGGASAVLADHRPAGPALPGEPTRVSGLDSRDFLHHRRGNGRWVGAVKFRDHMGGDVPLVLGLRVLYQVGEQRATRSCSTPSQTSTITSPAGLA